MNNEVPRDNTHIIETKSKDYLRFQIDTYNDGMLLYRDITERDYGIDGLIEMFDNGKPTGKIAFIQIKGTQKILQPLIRTPNMISCTISSSNTYYAYQKNIPIILIYVSVSTDNFYFLELNEIGDELKEIKGETKNVHIPITSKDNIEEICKIINKYYK